MMQKQKQINAAVAIIEADSRGLVSKNDARTSANSRTTAVCGARIVPIAINMPTSMSNTKMFLTVFNCSTKKRGTIKAIRLSTANRVLFWKP